MPSRTSFAKHEALDVDVKKSLASEIQQLFVEKLFIQVESVDMDLFQTGIFDSMTLVHFIPLLEEHFGLQFPMETLDIDSFRSVVQIAQFVADRKSADSED